MNFLFMWAGGISPGHWLLSLYRMVAYPSDIKQRVVYWEVTRDRDLTSMTWIKNWDWYCGEGRTILKVMYWMLAQLLTFWSIQHIKIKSMIAHIKISILTLFLKDRFKDLGDNLAVIYFYKLLLSLINIWKEKAAFCLLLSQ